MHPLSVSPLPRHDKIATLFSLGGVTLLAWTYLIDMAVRMNDMSVMSMPSATEILTIRVWSGRDFVVMFLMWTVMMIGMMVPTAVPTTLVYAAVARKAKAQHHTIAPTSVFIVGYVAAWTLFSLGATAAQWALDQAALLSPMMATTSPTVGATLLLAAGIYQLTPLKHACLTHCRGPSTFSGVALATRTSRCSADGVRTRVLLPRLLLDPDGAPLSGRCDEPALDRNYYASLYCSKR